MGDMLVSLLYNSFCHHPFLAQLFSVGLLFFKISNVFKHLRQCLLSVALLKLRHFGHFWPKNPRLLSLFSVCLLTIQETTSNEINHLRGGGLQSILVGLGDKERRMTRTCVFAAVAASFGSRFARRITAYVIDKDKSRLPALYVDSRIPWVGMHEKGGVISAKMLIPLHGRVGRKRFKAQIEGRV
ncbi:MAG: hypothetical protein IPN53_18265 [Comamonadaceae bacterium]|nr:hypothetical protein [Comamonadaceae bacterium]